MPQRIVIDPITRIEGHLRIEVEVENGKVKEAWSSGTMARGWEIILCERDPRDAPYVTSRVCGVCEGVHTLASAHALEHAFRIAIPEAGRLMRNLSGGGLYIHDHYIHFYVLAALDYIDIVAVTQYKGKDPTLLAIKEKVVKLANMKDLHPFIPRYEPDEYCLTDPEIVTTLVFHYIKAIEMKAKSQKMLSILAGIQPHPNAIIMGGCTATPSVEELYQFRQLWKEQVDFVNNIYLPDVIALGTGPLFPLAKIGFGRAHGNYLCYPILPRKDPVTVDDYAVGGTDHLIKGGAVIGGELEKVEAVDYTKITEDVTSSWYEYPPGVEVLHPSEGVTKFDVKKAGAYSFVKAPRYKDLPMEVGPLARGVVNRFPELMDFFKMGGKGGIVARHLCRALIAKYIGDAGFEWIDRLIELASKGPIVGVKDVPVPSTGQGMGLWDAPRGALGHWVRVEDHRIKNYQLIVPTTWNASPRDRKGVRGPYEEALIDCPVPDVNNPINIVRIIRSFDPCLACAIHLIDTQTNEVKVFRVR